MGKFREKLKNTFRVHTVMENLDIYRPGKVLGEKKIIPKVLEKSWKCVKFIN